MEKTSILQSDQDAHGAHKEDIFLAQDRQGKTLGVLLLYPFYDELIEAEHPHNIALHLHIPPGQQLSEEDRDRLLEKGIERAAQIKDEAGQVKTRLYMSFLKDQLERSEHLIKWGFQQDESMQILERSSGLPLPDVYLPEGITLEGRGMDTEEEWQRFIAIHRTVFPRHPYSLERLSELSSLPGFGCLAALQGNKLCGNIIFHAVPDHPGRGWIEDLIVISGWRRQGIGGSLLAAALSKMEKGGSQSVRLETWSANIGAGNLYREFGFQVVDETEFAYGLYV